MTGLTLALTGFALMLGGIFLRVPIALAMALTGFFGTWYVLGTPNAPMAQLKTLTYETFSNQGLSIVPLFLLMGQFATRTGMSSALFRAASDWLGGANLTTSQAWQRYRELGHLEFTMATAAETEKLMATAGLVEISSRDRNAWYAELARFEVEQIDGPLRDQLVAAVGAEIHGHWLAVSRSTS